MTVQVSWNQVRDEAYYFVIADLTTDGWQFWERDSWEIRWFRMKATGELIAKAESFLRNQEIATTAVWSAKIRPEQRNGNQALIEFGVANVHSSGPYR